MRLPAIAWVDFKKHTGISVFRWLQTVIDYGEQMRAKVAGGMEATQAFAEVDIDAEQLIYLLWTTLRFEDPELSLEAVGLMLDFGNLIPVLSALTQLISGAVPEGDKDGANGQGPMLAQTSTPTGSLSGDTAESTSGSVPVNSGT